MTTTPEAPVKAEEAGGPTPQSRQTFDRHPDSYRHWKLSIDGPVATLSMNVDPAGGARQGEYELKMNSYDIGVDVELYDAVQRLRFEHPEVHSVVMTSGVEKMFCAGANIKMLAGSTHHHKVNFCKFTNETRNSIEDASAHSGQTWICAANGTAAGGGYELALACDHIILIDDRASAVSLPEVPLLGVLPGTGGLTRVVDKRFVRKDRADLFATRTEGIRGQQAVDWKLVDELAPRSNFEEVVRARAEEFAAHSDRPAEGPGVEWVPLERTEDGDRVTYPHVRVEKDRKNGSAAITITGPEGDGPEGTDDLPGLGVRWWPLAVARELDEALLDLRFNEPELCSLVLRTEGDPAKVAAVDGFLADNAAHWLVRETRLFLARTLKRLDLTAKTIVTLVEPGSCFAGTLAELVFAADRSYMLDGIFEDLDEEQTPATLTLGEANTGTDGDSVWYPMSNGLSRLQSRFWGDDEALQAALAAKGEALEAADAEKLGLVTSAPDDIDWEDEVRLTLEERNSFSPDALTGMEANYRFVGPETMETKIFGRLTAWQNWIFQRPNASGPEGALRKYGTGARANFDNKRV